MIIKYPYFSPGSAWNLKKADFTIFTDGASSILNVPYGDGKKTPVYYGASAFVVVKDGCMIDSGTHSGQYKTGQTELIAMGLALKWMRDNGPRKCRLQIVSDSMYAIESLTEYCWRSAAALTKMKNSNILARLNVSACELILDGGDIFCTHVKGHSGVRFNEEADKLAVKAKTEYIEAIHPGLVSDIQKKFPSK